MIIDHEREVLFIQQHLSWNPLMEVRDVYKLLYQGVMGSEHIISSPEKYKSNLLQELDELLADPAERLLVPVRADKMLMRINLRPWKALHFEIDPLIKALLETGEMSMGTPELLQAAWARFAELCETRQIQQFSTNTVHGFGAWLVEMAFPVVHHSDIYRRAYHPAYRLISPQFLARLGLTDAG